MDVSESVDGLTAIVTGASSGIGRETARVFADHGMNVVLAARSETRLEEVKGAIEADGGTALVAPTDVRSRDDVRSTVEATVERFGEIDVVISNAGIVREADVELEDLTETDYRDTVGTNVDGSFFVSSETLPHLRDSNGRLVFVGSAAGNGVRPELPVYAATKWWLSGFARSVESLVGSEGVGVSLINPSEVTTDIGGDEEAVHEGRNEDLFLTPEDVAESILFIVSRAEHVNVSELDLYRRDKRSYLYK